MTRRHADPISPAARAEPVVVVPYDGAWPRRFAALRSRLLTALGDLAVAVEHVGSTAVPGLAAKPIVDVDVVIRREEDLFETAQRLSNLGYAHIGDLGVAGREAFRQPPDLPPHHLYVCVAGTVELQRHLAFRDALRADGELAARYAALKHDLAERYRDDRDAYSEGKTRFIAAALSAAPKPDRRRHRR